MRLAIPHTLGKEEALRRIKGREHELASFVPGFAEVSTSWPADNRLELHVGAMGQAIDGSVEVGEAAVVFVIDLPPALSFVEPMIEKAIGDKGRKLLS